MKNVKRFSIFRPAAVCALALSLISGSAFAVSMNFSGQVRAEASSYQNLNLGLAGPSGAKNFIGGRALLFPNLVIDDHFSVKSQWNLLTSPKFTPNATQGLGTGQGGWVFGDPNTSYLTMSRAWLEWTSDVGVFRLGRMPVAWGYGLVYDAGLGVWDDFQTTFDRLEYRLHLGYVVGALAYSKGRKLSSLGNDNDQEFYVAYLQYNNPEMEVEAGFMFEKQQRSGSQTAALMGTGSPYYLDPTTSAAGFPQLASKTSWPASNNLVDVYFKKTSGAFTIGGELAWLSGTATDFANSGAKNNLSAIGLTLNTSYEFSKVKAFLEFVYASGDTNLNDSQTSAFTVLHRNRRPGLILGRELLGPYNSSAVGQGSTLWYGGNDAFSGTMYFRPGVRIDWTSDWASGIELIIARKAVAAGGSENLGVEIDLGADHAVYKNFGLGMHFGYLIAGAGLGGGNNAPGPFALRATASVSF